MTKKILGLLAVVVLLHGCSTDEKKSETPEGAYEIAKDYFENERYEEAIRRFNEVRNRFPYSRFALLAELAVADSYFAQESYVEAQVAYQSFKELHPKHERIDYVTFRLALSYYEQLPSTIDRDLSLATSAILYFDEVIRLFPRSEHVPEAQDKRLETQKMLAEKEEYIADFYFKKEKWDSALSRYEGLFQSYPGLGFDEKALARSAISAKRAGDLDRAKRFQRLLENRFPQSAWLKDVAKEIN